MNIKKYKTLSNVQRVCAIEIKNVEEKIWLVFLFW